jgi:predicted AAA+ superfamily ATPase
MEYVARIIPLAKELAKKTVLLLGLRRTGKSTLIKHEVKADQVYNLLESNTFQQLARRPSLIRESLTGKEKLIVIDEIQKLPNLMDEVHLMLEDKKVKFLITGSSARKLKRTHTSLMAGRAHTMRLMPFCYSELPDFNLHRRLLHGALPPIWLSETPWDELLDYSGDYLREEIQAEALSRNIEGFSRFLFQAALTNTELLNFESIASDAQVPPRTIREYYAILQDTLLGTVLEPFSRTGNKKQRKAVSKAKFYFSDIGIVHALTNQKELSENTPQFGKAFEHFIFQELWTYLHYFQKSGSLNFWRTHTGIEVDFIFNEEIAIEVKATSLVQEKHIKNLKAFMDETSMKRYIIVSMDKRKRKLGKIEVYPYELFLEELWAKKF